MQRRLALQHVGALRGDFDIEMSSQPDDADLERAFDVAQVFVGAFVFMPVSANKKRRTSLGCVPKARIAVAQESLPPLMLTQCSSRLTTPPR